MTEQKPRGKSFSKQSPASFRIRRRRDLVDHEFDGVVYILDPKENDVRILNNTASLIWNRARRPVSVKDLASTIQRRFDVSPQKALKDTETFVKKYLKIGIFERTGQKETRR